MTSALREIDCSLRAPTNRTKYAYDANNRIAASPGPLAYGFDADGNLTSKTGETFGYDFTNRLTSFIGAGTAAAYAYDPFGRRIRKIETVSGVTTWYLWDGDQLLAEYDATGARTVRYAYAGGFAPAQVAYRDGAGEDVYDVHTDHLDTPRLLTDDTGTVVWREAHEAFGRAHPDEDPDGDLTEITFNVRFPGQYFDAESGLHDNRFRTYDPGIGRYVSADPIGQLGGINLYEFALNSPVSLFDPFGLRSYLVSRPTSPSFASHNFVVTDADYIGDPNATVHSFGQNAEGNVGNVGPGTNPSSFSATTYQSDVDYWKSLGSANACMVDPSTNPNLSEIPATDAAVADFASRLVEDQDYSAIAGPFGANSSSAAQAVADTAAGAPVPTPGGPRISPGAGSAGEVNFR